MNGNRTEPFLIIYVRVVVFDVMEYHLERNNIVPLHDTRSHFLSKGEKNF